MFPFERPKDYSEMLNKIGICTWALAILLTIYVGHSVAEVNATLSAFKITVKVFSIEIPVLYAVPGTLIAIFARIIRLHNWISKTFRIRARFDLFRIIVPLAGAVGFSASLPALEKNREVLMDRTFYSYASFSDPKISKELVLSSIDAWSWYWALLEFSFLLALTSGFLMYFRSYEAANVTLIGFAGTLLVFPSVFFVCGKKAMHQIDEIVSDDARSQKIKSEFYKQTR